MEDHYQSLREKLEVLEWPTIYMFKFIVPIEKKEEIITLFDGREITSRLSKTGKYFSVTSNVFLENVDQVISIYKEASDIEGIIAL